MIDLYLLPAYSFSLLARLLVLCSHLWTLGCLFKEWTDTTAPSSSELLLMMMTELLDWTLWDRCYPDPFVPNQGCLEHAQCFVELDRGQTSTSDRKLTKNHAGSYGIRVDLWLLFLFRHCQPIMNSTYIHLRVNNSHIYIERGGYNIKRISWRNTIIGRLIHI
jgi:hypothetical protein